MTLGTTDTGYKNKNKQQVLGPSDMVSNHENQKLYELKCLDCDFVYRANGCDIHIRRCPKCQGGAVSSEVN